MNSKQSNTVIFVFKDSGRHGEVATKLVHLLTKKQPHKLGLFKAYVIIEKIRALKHNICKQINFM